MSFCQIDHLVSSSWQVNQILLSSEITNIMMSIFIKSTFIRTYCEVCTVTFTDVTNRRTIDAFSLSNVKMMESHQSEAGWKWLTITPCYWLVRFNFHLSIVSQVISSHKQHFQRFDLLTTGVCFEEGLDGGVQLLA